jgi:hypothetical protein
MAGKGGVMDDLPIVDPYGDEFKDSAQANAPRVSEIACANLDFQEPA